MKQIFILELRKMMNDASIIPSFPFIEFYSYMEKLIINLES